VALTVPNKHLMCRADPRCGAGISGAGVERSWNPAGATGPQLHPLVVPQDSQTKHDPAGRIRTPQVEQ
jgi:hypothetical protein